MKTLHAIEIPQFTSMQNGCVVEIEDILRKLWVEETNSPSHIRISVNRMGEFNNAILVQHSRSQIIYCEPSYIGGFLVNSYHSRFSGTFVGMQYAQHNSLLVEFVIDDVQEIAVPKIKAFQVKAYTRKIRLED